MFAVADRIALEHAELTKKYKIPKIDVLFNFYRLSPIFCLSQDSPTVPWLPRETIKTLYLSLWQSHRISTNINQSGTDRNHLISTLLPLPRTISPIRKGLSPISSNLVLTASTSRDLTTTIIPMPLLKVFHISSSGILPLS